jgi:hypothetical protein
MKKPMMMAISPVTFINDEIKRDPDLNSLYVAPFINDIYLDGLKAQSRVDNVTMRLCDNDYYTYMKNSKVVSIQNFILNNSRELIYTIILKFFLDNNIDVSSLPLFNLDTFIDYFNKSGYANKRYSSMAGINIDLDMLLGYDLIGCYTQKDISDDEFRHLWNVEIDTVLDGMFSCIFNTAVNMINQFISQIVYNYIIINNNESIFYSLYNLCYNKEPKEETSKDAQYTFCSSILREISMDYVKMIREGLEEIKLSTANMIILANTELERDAKNNKELNPNVLTCNPLLQEIQEDNNKIENKMEEN